MVLYLHSPLPVQRCPLDMQGRVRVAGKNIAAHDNVVDVFWMGKGV
jgi:hypothetical protein